MELVSVVLVQPKNSGNIGAVARAMLNMGAKDLRLVLPQCDPLERESLDRARESKWIVEQAQVYLSVDRAVADCGHVWGTSRRVRDLPCLSPSQAATKLFADGVKTALVFGPEDRGLSNEELTSCDSVISIPTSDEFPSLNLSHAVMVMLYQIYSAMLPEAVVAPKEFSTSAEREGFYKHLQEALTKIEFLEHHNPDYIMRDLRDLFNRSYLTGREVTILRGICRQILNKTS